MLGADAVKGKIVIDAMNRYALAAV